MAGNQATSDTDFFGSLTNNLPGAAAPQVAAPESLTHSDWGKTVELNVNGEKKTVTVEELTRAYQQVGGIEKLNAQADSLRGQVAELRSTEQQMDALRRLTQGGDPIETMNALIAQNAALQAQVSTPGSQPQGGVHDPYGSGSDADNVQAMLQQAITAAITGPLTEMAQRQQQLESALSSQTADTQRNLAFRDLQSKYPNADMDAVQRHVDDLSLPAEKLEVAFTLAQAESGQPATPAGESGTPGITMDVTTSTTPPGDLSNPAAPSMSVATPPGGLPPGSAPTAPTMPDRSQFTGDTMGDAGYAASVLAAGGNIGSVADGLPIG